MVVHSKARQYRKMQKFRMVIKITVLFLAVSITKFIIFWDNIGDPSQFSTPFPNCLYQVLCQRYLHPKLPLSCEVVKNCFRTPIFAEWQTRIFYGSLLQWIPATMQQSLVEFCGLQWIPATMQQSLVEFCGLQWIPATMQQSLVEFCGLQWIPATMQQSLVCLLYTSPSPRD